MSSVQDLSDKLADTRRARASLQVDSRCASADFSQTCRVGQTSRVPGGPTVAGLTSMEGYTVILKPVGLCGPTSRFRDLDPPYVRNPG